MELRNITTFLKAAELNNFVKVAEELGYAPSTVSNHIQQLEEELGFPLFNRISRRVTLTSKGREFLRYAEELIKLVNQMILLKKEKYPIEGDLRFGVVESLLSSVVLPLLPNFLRVYPGIKILFKSASTAELFEMLKHGDQDLIFGIGKQFLDKDCQCVYSHPEELVFITSISDPLANVDRLPLVEVLKQPLIMPEKDSFYRRTIEELAAEKGILIEPVLTLDNSRSILQLVCQGLGIAFLPKYVLQKDVISDKLAILKVEEKLPQFWSQLFCHKRRWISPSMQAVIEMLRQRY